MKALVIKIKKVQINESLLIALIHKSDVTLLLRNNGMRLNSVHLHTINFFFYYH